VKKGLDQRGVEPLALQIFAGIILLVIGLGIAYGIYMWAGKGSTSLLSYNVSLSPNSATMTKPTDNNVSTSVSVSVSRIAPYDKIVTLTATGVPDNVAVSFSPNTGTPSFGSTMTITVGVQAVQKKTTITIKATGADAVEQTATFELTVA